MREIVINAEDFRHVAKAVVNYRNGRDRIDDSVLVVADHIRAGRRHIVDSLSSGEHAKWEADDALMAELVTQVLVAVQIVVENKSHVKYRMRETMACEAQKRSDELFESKKNEIIRAEQDEWLAFNEWRRRKSTEERVKAKKRGAGA